MQGVKYLVMVTTNNNNKYYKMVPVGDFFRVEYGRLGQSGFQTATYPMSQFNKKYNEKVRKGYIDRTEMIAELIEEDKPKEEEKEVEYAPISNSKVAEIVKRIQDMAKRTIAANYKVASNLVTQKMIDASQECLNALVSVKSVEKFNQILLENFSIISRRMSNVNDCLAKATADFDDIISREQDLLNVMAGQVVQNTVEKEESDKDSKKQGSEDKKKKTILKTMGDRKSTRLNSSH